MLSRLSLAWKLTLAAGLAISALLLTASVLVVFYAGSMVRDLSDSNLQALADEATAEVVASIGRVQSSADAMARALGSAYAKGVHDRKQLMAIIEPQATVEQKVLGSWFMEAPNTDGADASLKGDAASGSNSRGEFVPYFVHDGGEIKLEPLDTGTDFEQPFYTLAAQSGKPAITEPYPYEIGGKAVLMTSVCF